MKYKSSHHPLAFTIILLFFIFLSYSNCIHKEFMLDDYVNLIGNDSLNSVSVVDLFVKDFKGYYRPVTFAILKGALSVFGQNPVTFHLYNAAIFFAICWLFYLLLGKVTRRPDLAMLASLLYAVHPINNFFLNYKTASSLSINILCLQLGALLFVQYLDTRKILFYAAAVLMYAVSLFAHEMNFLLPAYVFLIMYYFRDFNFKKDGRLFIPYLAAAVFYILIRTGVTTAIKVPSVLSLGIPLSSYLATMAALAGWYITKLIFPAHIIFIWDERIMTGPAVIVCTLLFIFILIGLIAVFLKGKKNSLTFGLILFSTGLLPLALAGFTYTNRFNTAIIEPHWFGFSSIGFFIVVASLCLSLKEFLPHRVGIFLIVLILVGSSVLTRAANNLWKDGQTYCRYWFEENSLNGTVWHCLAARYIETHDLGQEPGYYKSCREVSYLAGAYHGIGQAQLAFDYYDLALKINPQCVDAYYGLSLLYDQLEKMPEAELNLNKALTLDARYYPVYKLLLSTFHNRGEKEDGRKIIKYLRDIEGGQINLRRDRS